MMAALAWLKTNNPLYGNVLIERDALNLDREEVICTDKIQDANSTILCLLLLEVSVTNC